MENSYQDKESEKLLGVCKFLLTIYQELQSHSKTSEQTKRKERVEVGKWTLEGIQRVKEQNHKSTSTCSFKEKRKI